MQREIGAFCGGMGESAIRQAIERLIRRMDQEEQLKMAGSPTDWIPAELPGGGAHGHVVVVLGADLEGVA